MRKYTVTTISEANRHCPFADKVEKALVTPIRRFPMLKNYIFVVDEENDDFAILFPSNDINKVNRQLKEIVLSDLSNNFKKAGLNLIERKGIVSDIYRVGFIAIIYRIKPL